MKLYRIVILVSLMLFFIGEKTHGQDTLSIDALMSMSFDDLLSIKVISSSMKEENSNEAFSNITVITKEMIEERGYQTLVEICEDLPGFDFMLFNDGTGEYPTSNLNRGTGSVGNTKILIMVDGIVQNNISFNWSLLWTYENLLNDIERIEVIEGPGSALYGAQAYSGIIHFITRSKFTGLEIKTFYGSNFTRGIDLFAGTNFKNDVNLTFAFHNYVSDGDGGDRYDPGGYFHNNKYPETILKDYDENGNYVTNVQNPKGGELIPDGFNDWQNSYSARIKLTMKNTEIGAFYWNSKNGSGSYVPGYEYNVTAPDFQSHKNGYHAYIKNNLEFSDKISLESNIVARSTNVLPVTGLIYHYRFPNMTKNYVAYSFQTYLEERLFINLSNKTDLLFGIKAMTSYKSNRVVSLDYFPNNISSTQSSWEIANSGGGLGVTKHVPMQTIYEFAAYGLWTNKWSTWLSSSIGLRYDYSSEYGHIVNPRLGLIYMPFDNAGIKLLYGSAFKQPSFFELNSEFRGNPDIEPEKVQTYEIELYSSFYNKKAYLRANIFYSVMKDFIDLVPDSTMPSGERFENLDRLKVSGVSVYANYQFNSHIKFYSNYMFILGKLADSVDWEQIPQTAKHKINAGINLKILKEKLIVDCRVNWVGKRKAQTTNYWLIKYENGYAPSYTKVNLTVTYRFLKKFSAQFIIKNLLNEQFYGVGRESGSGMVDDYDYQTNPNPSGFIPAYHPQPGRTFLVTLKYSL